MVVYVTRLFPLYTVIKCSRFIEAHSKYPAPSLKKLVFDTGKVFPLTEGFFPLTGKHFLIWAAGFFPCVEK